jgi:hypothetical protein
MLAQQWRMLAAFVVASLLVVPTGTFAQERDGSFVGGVIKSTVLDPTTYAPAILNYDSTIRDWNTSQPFFQNGFVERNARFTLSGRANDRAISYSAGRAKILHDALGVLAVSAIHNASTRVIERALIERHPERRTMIKTFGWIERIAVASVLSYKLSAAHYRQWKHNERLMRELGIH